MDEITPRPWPEVDERDRWALDSMDELFASTDQSPRELRARAAYLRQSIQTADPGQRDAALALAERYEAAAIQRE